MTSTKSSASSTKPPHRQTHTTPPLLPRSVLDQYWQAAGAHGLIVRTALRTAQFILAITAAGIYGADLARDTATHTHGATDWVYACVVAALSAITCIVHCFVTVKRVAWCVWDMVLAVLWAAAFGVFASVYVGGKEAGGDGERGADVGRMKLGVAVDCVGMVLWVFTAVMGCAWCCRARRVTRRTDKLMEVEGEERDGTGDVEMGRRERLV